MGTKVALFQVFFITVFHRAWRPHTQPWTYCLQWDQLLVYYNTVCQEARQPPQSLAEDSEGLIPEWNFATRIASTAQHFCPSFPEMLNPFPIRWKN